MKNPQVDPSMKLNNSKLAPPKLQVPPLKDGGSTSDATSCISSTGGSVKESDLDHETAATDRGVYYPTSGYYGYYYPGYDGSFGEPENHGYFVGTEGMEIQYPVMQADNGSLIYLMPGYQPGYSPYMPVASMGPDGYSPMSPYPSTPISPIFPSTMTSPYGSELVPSSYLWEPSLVVGDLSHHPTYEPNPFSAPIGTRVPPLKAEFSNPRENNGSLLNPFKPVDKVSQHGSTFRPDPALTKSGLLYPTNRRGGWVSEKLKTKGKASNAGITDFGFINEQNHGPRATTTNTKGSLTQDRNENCSPVIRRDQYNLADFKTDYDHALFFIIKSYSEDDIHKSIKYNVWASTPNGNKRLDSAYQDALNKTVEKGSKCPLFLFFSVNASGQFCGVAEMVGRVDFNKNMDFWQQDKWTGSFPVKWHIIKDVPNPQLRHIILENNDNKPVTNSRDTQEVRFPQGIEMLNIFKNFVSKTSILDDFDFYESRQKVMQDKRMRPLLTHFDHHYQKTDELTASLQSINLSAAKDIEGPLEREKANE